MAPRTTAVIALALASCVRPPAMIAEPVAALLPPPERPVRRDLPISGGTLAISRDARLAAVSDPEGDRVWIVELSPLRVRAEVSLAPGDEPGRIVEDRGGRFHVALRRGGAIATIDDRGELVLRREACPAPRGIDLDPTGDAIHVACAGGELMTFGIFDDVPRRTLYLEPDLRDVIATHEELHVARFRSAEIVTVSDGGETRARRPPIWDLDAALGRTVEDRPRRDYEPAVAWRLAKDPSSDAVWMLHQRGARFPVDLRVDEEPPPSGYGGARAVGIGCEPGIAHATITPLESMAPRVGPGPPTPPTLLDHFDVLPSRREIAGPILPDGVLPVDLAIAPDGEHVAMAFAGSSARQLVVARTRELRGSTCASSLWEPGSWMPEAFRQPVSVAWIDRARIAVQYRQPHALVVYTVFGGGEPRFVRLGELAPRDRGGEIFHEATATNLACATCHPEGGDDGRVWDLGAFGGTRRTQTLHGDVLGSAPFHWAGDLASLDALVEEVFVGRMGGRTLGSDEVGELGAFLASLPDAPRASVRDPDAVARGREAFAEAGCGRCHSGPRMSDDRNHDVGTGEALQTPTLIGLATRPPYLHDGRAATLADRFARGHTAGHGDLSDLSAVEIDDMIAYLSSL